MADVAVWVGSRTVGQRRFAETGSAALFAVVAVNAVFVALLLPLQDYSRAYNHGIALHAPGAARIRLPRGTADAYRQVTEELKRRCSTFVSLPGLDSFYFLADQPAPTLLNAGDWMYLFDDAQQQQVVDAVRGIPRLCAIRHDGIAAFWQEGRPLPQRPLVRFIETAFKPKPVFSVAGFKLLVRKE
jgi:hypothetical protein